MHRLRPVSSNTLPCPYLVHTHHLSPVLVCHLQLVRSRWRLPLRILHLEDSTLAMPLLVEDDLSYVMFISILCCCELGTSCLESIISIFRYGYLGIINNLQMDI